MSDKQPKLPPLDPGDFQLDPHKADMHNMIANGLVKAFCDYANNADLNHDGKRDIVQYGPTILKMVQLFAMLAPLINVEKVKEFVLGLPIFHDREAAKVVIEQCLKEATALAAAVQK